MERRKREGKKLLFNTVDELMDFWISGKGLKEKEPELINLFGVMGDECNT